MRSRAPFLRWQRPDRVVVGLNCMQPFGYGAASGGVYTGTPYTNGGADTTVMPDTRLANTKAAGFDFIRIAVDVGPLMAAANDAALDTLIGQITTGIGRRTAAGLRVIVDMHVLQQGQHPVSGWSAQDIIATIALTDTKFVRLKYVVTRLAAAMWALKGTTCKPSEVCLELFNEPPMQSQFGAVLWQTQAANYWRAVRDVCDFTLIIGGNDLNTLDNFLSGSGSSGTTALTPSAFDANTGFSFHPYESAVFTHQGTAFTIYEDMHGLTFPAANYPGGLTQAKADFTAAANAAGHASNIPPVVTNVGWASSLDTYFNTLGTKAALATRLGILTTWGDSNSLLRKQLMNTEFGLAFGGADNRPTSGDAYPTDAAAFVQATRENAEAAGINCIVIHEAQGSNFGVQDSTTPWALNSSIAGALFP